MLKNLSEEEKNKRRKKAQGRYQNFTEEKKEKTSVYREYNKNLSEERKQKLFEYRRNSCIKNK